VLKAIHAGPATQHSESSAATTSKPQLAPCSDGHVLFAHKAMLPNDAFLMHQYGSLVTRLVLHECMLALPEFNICSLPSQANLAATALFALAIAL